MKSLQERENNTEWDDGEKIGNLNNSKLILWESYTFNLGAHALFLDFEKAFHYVDTNIISNTT